jgi:cytochrome c-type biogenesis protein CcmH
MALWIAFAVLLVAALATIGVPLFARTGPTASTNHDAEVYKDQIGEIDRDARAGLIGTDEAIAARAEISRRLLAVTEAGAGEPDAISSKRSLAAMVVSLSAVLVTAYVVYGALGVPIMPDFPLAERVNASPAAKQIDELVVQMEKHLVANPEQGRGWEVLAPVYFRLERHDDAVLAYRNTVRILGSSAQRQADLGEAMTAANGGIVSAEAQQAFERALVHDGLAVKPRFFLAMALTQDGEKVAAIAAWENLLRQAKGSDGWARIARAQIAALRQGPGSAGATQAAPKLEMSDEQRQMIEGMVSGLAERLKESGGSVDEWRRLIRSYVVLGKPSVARDVLASARTAYGQDPAALSKINDMAVRFSLDR